MKKIAVLLFSMLLFSCKSLITSPTQKPLYEVLTKQNDGGGPIRFYEIVTEESELPMLLGDENLKNKVQLSDSKTSNFVLLNYGENTKSGSTFEITQAGETADKIVLTITIKEGTMDLKAGSKEFPYWIVKVNSKKEIILQ